MKIGILGGGQLAVMLAKSVSDLDIQFIFLCPEPITDLEQYGDVIQADYTDLKACAVLVNACDIITYENEQIPLETVDFCLQSVPVHPNAKALEKSQDRLVEKRYLHSLGLRTAPFLPVGNETELADATANFTFPAILKRRFGGYDGKGQAWIDSADELAAAWTSLDNAPCVLEGVIRFEREVSMIAARNTNGDTVFYPVSENGHSDGILRVAITRPNDPQQQQAEEIAQTLVDGLDYCGTFTVEMFDCQGELIVNEVAPRVHNSGHWSIEAAQVSQFRNHILAISGQGPQAPAISCLAAMVNLIGELPDLNAVKKIQSAHTHLYGKEARPKRKLGHITVVETENLTQFNADVETVVALVEDGK